MPDTAPKRVDLLPAGLLLGGMVSVQVGAAVAMHVFTQVGPTSTVMLRLCLAAVFLGVGVRPDIRGARSRWAPLLALGLSVGLMNWLFYESISRIPLGNTVTLEFVGPLVLALITSHRLVDTGWALLAGVGVALLGSTSGLVLGTGGILALTAGACWAAYIVLSHRVGQLFSDADGLTISMAVAGATFLPFGIASGGARLLSPSVLGLGVIVALLASVIPYSFDMAALRMVAPRFYATFYSLEPAIAAAVGAIFLRQSVTLRDAIAIVCVASASIGVTWQLRRPNITLLEP